MATRLRVPPESSATGRSHSLTPSRSSSRRASWAVSQPPRCSTRSESADELGQQPVVERRSSCSVASRAASAAWASMAALSGRPRHLQLGGDGGARGRTPAPAAGR